MEIKWNFKNPKELERRKKIKRTEQIGKKSKMVVLNPTTLMLNVNYLGQHCPTEI